VEPAKVVFKLRNFIFLPVVVLKVTFKVFNAVAQKVEVGLKLLQSVFGGFIV
jgi:hypothetical protein